MKIVYLLWLDSQHFSGWRYSKDIGFDYEEMLHETVGFLYHETDYSYAIIQSKSKVLDDDTGQIDSLMEIPKVAVIEFKELNVQ